MAVLVAPEQQTVATEGVSARLSSFAVQPHDARAGFEADFHIIHMARLTHTRIVDNAYGRRTGALMSGRIIGTGDLGG
ncbi:hypothetical protein [Parvularcula marina]|uniref:hypothetical protein n=1 Tax=Parvularcula marina TaxID=2292771 RepID=UPI00355A400E